MKKTLIGLVLITLAVSAQATTYDIDPVHSNVGFRVRHLVGKVTGRFEKFEGTFDYEPGKPQTWKAAAKVDANSINTKIQKRDDHLRSPDFFDTAKCADISFKSTEVTDVKGDTAKLHGNLTMHCITKPVVLDLEMGGVVKNPLGEGTRAGATATGKINRKDFGIIWNKTLDAGSLMLGEDVEIMLEIEGTSKK